MKSNIAVLLSIVTRYIVIDRHGSVKGFFAASRHPSPLEAPIRRCGDERLDPVMSGWSA
jgi:hypothetical protein